MGRSRGGGRGSGPTLKNHKNIGFPSNTGPYPPEKSQSYKASIQCRAIIGLPALMAFCWRANDGRFTVVFGSSIPSSTKKKVIKFGPPLTKISGSSLGLKALPNPAFAETEIKKIYSTLHAAGYYIFLSFCHLLTF